MWFAVQLYKGQSEKRRESGARVDRQKRRYSKMLVRIRTAKEKDNNNLLWGTPAVPRKDQGKNRSEI